MSKVKIEVLSGFVKNEKGEVAKPKDKFEIDKKLAERLVYRGKAKIIEKKAK